MCIPTQSLIPWKIVGLGKRLSKLSRPSSPIWGTACNGSRIAMRHDRRLGIFGGCLHTRCTLSTSQRRRDTRRRSSRIQNRPFQCIARQALYPRQVSDSCESSSIAHDPMGISAQGSAGKQDSFLYFSSDSTAGASKNVSSGGI